MKHLLTLALACLVPCASPAQDTKKDDPKPAERVKLTTSMGDIVLELDRDKAPVTVENFLSYVKKGHYDGTVFHRVIGNFMIQGGGFADKDGTLTQKKSGKGIKNEGKNGLKNRRGTIAMARTSVPDSATAQFFINVQDNAGLDFPNPDGHGYAVFGKVVEGMDVVDKIKAVETGTKPLVSLTPSGQEVKQPAKDVPLETVTIKKAEIVQPD
jgi:peptidyl-prolyl cis-trans isomerase A (cyclophilin A)